MVEKDILRLYGNKAKDVTLHMDSVPAHISHQTVQWLEDRKIKFIPKAEWITMIGLALSIPSEVRLIIRIRAINHSYATLKLL